MRTKSSRNFRSEARAYFNPAVQFNTLAQGDLKGLYVEPVAGQD